MVRHAWLLAIPAAALLACGQDSVSYDGEVHPQVVGAHEVADVSELPHGYRIIGRVSAQCSDDDTGDFWDDCSEYEVVEMMREEAADVGGELLVGRICYTDRDVVTRHHADDDGSWTETTISVNIDCSADVARWARD